jgi:bis(5'-nucleosyl)-tetraphosphatase (symmetrical)
VLRHVKKLGSSAKVVLGNHDLNLLAVAFGNRESRNRDTLNPILKARDGDELLNWLRHQPLLQHDKKLGYTMVHAGLPPEWNLKHAQEHAHEVEKVLQGRHYKAFLRHMYGDKPDHWKKSLHGWGRLRYCTNALTRIRYCSANGRLNMETNGPVGSQGKGLIPWFEVPGRASARMNLVFGHWSALGSLKRPGIIALDSGCVWGEHLTAIRLDKPGKFIKVNCR